MTKKKYRRRDQLLAAAYYLLKKQEDADYVLDLLAETVFYDGTDCEGSCLLGDIENELDLDIEGMKELVHPSVTG